MGTGVGVGVCWLSCVDWLAGVVCTSVGGARERHGEVENFCSVTTRGCEVRVEQVLFRLRAPCEIDDVPVKNCEIFVYLEQLIE